MRRVNFSASSVRVCSISQERKQLLYANKIQGSGTWVKVPVKEQSMKFLDFVNT